MAAPSVYDSLGNTFSIIRIDGENYYAIPQQVQVQQVQIQQQQIMHMSPPRADSLSSPPPVTGQQSGLGQSPPSNSCIRQGCPNPAIANSEWEDEYCSNECVVSHCRFVDVFTTWVSSNPNSQQNFSTVK
uniref:Tox4_0 protein n=1 Tax=Fopius arisanus TaxID=64838 RepID=A0A0C9R8P6_9HYME